jgi:hypothetical protein
MVVNKDTIFFTKSKRDDTILLEVSWNSPIGNAESRFRNHMNTIRAGTLSYGTDTLEVVV